jgi:hypothetical protein
MQTTSNTSAFIHKQQYGGKKKMKDMKKKPMKKAAVKKPMAKGAKKMAKPKKQGY